MVVWSLSCSGGPSINPAGPPSAKEFLFWTTQGWAKSALIALSPGANLLEFKRDFYVVDNIKDEFAKLISI